MTASEPSTVSFITDSEIGFSLTTVDNPISTTSISGTAGLAVPNLGPQLTPGQKYSVNAGTVLYGCAGVTIAVGDLVYFSYDSTYGEFTAKEATTAAISTTQYAGGIALAAMTAGQFGWFFIGGGYCNASVAASVTAGGPLYTFTTGGQLSTSSAGSAVVINGSSSITTTTAAAVVLCYFSRGINFN